MGRALVACAGACDIEVVGVIASAHSPAVGQDAGEMAGVHRLGVAVTTDLGAALRAAQVVIDFSLPHFARDHVDQCALARAPLVLGTTGLPEDIEADLARAAVRIPLLVAPNTSLGVALLQDLVQRAAKALPADFDVSIAEAHHRAKKDAPSGTALALGRSVSAGREEGSNSRSCAVETSWVSTACASSGRGRRFRSGIGPLTGRFLRAEPFRPRPGSLGRSPGATPCEMYLELIQLLRRELEMQAELRWRTSPVFAHGHPGRWTLHFGRNPIVGLVRTRREDVRENSSRFVHVSRGMIW